MAVYDKKHEDEGNTLTRADDDELRQITGIDSDTEKQMEDRASNGAADDTAEREGLDKLEGNNKDEQKKDDDKKEDNKESGNDLAPTLGNNEPKKKSVRGRFLNRKTAIGGGIAGLLIGGGFGLFGILSGPAQIIHFSQLLQQFHFTNNDNFSNSRSSRYLFHRMRAGTLGAGYAKMETRLGVTGNRVADVMEIKLQNEAGLRSLYDTNTGNLVGYEVVDEAKMVNTLIDADISPDTDLEFRNSADNVIGADGSRGTTRRVLLFKVDADGARTQLKFRRQFHKSVTKTLGMNKLANAVGFRKSARRAGLDLSPLRRLNRAADETRVEFARRLKNAWSDEIRNGRRPARTTDVTLTDSEGNVTPESADADREGKIAQNDARTDPDGAKGRLGGANGKIAAGGVVGIGVLCAIRDISQSVELVKYANIVLPLMRIGTKIVATGGQVMTGKNLTMEELGVVSEMLYSEELGSWASARSVQYEMGQEMTGPDIPASAKPSRIGEKPAVFRIVDEIFKKASVAGSAACSRIGQFVLGAVTGGLVSEAIFEVVGSVASAAGLNPLDMFAEWAVNTLAGEEVPGDPEGTDLGNMANYGAGLAAREQMFDMGGTALTPAELGLLDAESREDTRREFRQQNFFARTFSLNEPGSLAAKTLFQNGTLASLQSSSASITAPLLNILPNLGSAVSRIFIPKTFAQADYDYGFDEHGFTLEEQEDERFDDPYENARIVEENLEHFVSEYGNCFSTRINPQTYAPEDTGITSFDELDPKCSNRSDEGLTRYRFYLADTLLVKSLACYERIEDAQCNEVGFGAQNAGTPPPSINAPGLNGYTIPCAGQPRPVNRIGGSAPRADWSGIPSSGVIGTGSDGSPINVYIREACDSTNIKTIFIASSIHGSESGGQFVSHELLFNENLPRNIRVIAIPEINKAGILGRSARYRVNANGVNLNRNFAYNWTLSNRGDNYNDSGPSAASEPETQALVNFLNSLGSVELSLHYHDNISWVAAAGSTNVSIARAYAAHTPDTPLRAAEGGKVYQAGSLDGWHNQRFGIPTLLIELSNDQSPQIIQGHVRAIQALISGGHL